MNVAIEEGALGAGLRPSLAWRLGAGAAKLSPWLEAAPGPVSADDFLSRVAGELAWIQRRTDRIWRSAVKGAELRPELRLDPNDLRLRVVIQQGKNVHPHIEFAVGAALAMDDLALFATCDPLFLAPSTVPRQNAPALCVAFDVVGDCEGEPPGLRDYRRIFTAGVFEPRRVVYAQPSSLWRLLQASMVSELMLAFLLLHERGHLALGHLDAMEEASEGRVARSTLAELGSVGDDLECAHFRLRDGPPLGPAERRVFELGADASAFQVLYAYASGHEGPCARYERALRFIGAPSAISRAASTAERLRLCLTAATLACFLFHLGVNLDPLRRDPNYPSPQARLMNLMIRTLVLSTPTCRHRPGFVLSPDVVMERRAQTQLRTSFGDVYTLALNDLWIVSALFGGQFSPLAAGEQDAAAWVRDIAGLWIARQASGTAPQTRAGLELQSLLPVERSLIKHLRRLQRRRFGMETRVSWPVTAPRKIGIELRR